MFEPVLERIFSLYNWMHEVGYDPQLYTIPQLFRWIVDTLFCKNIFRSTEGIVTFEETSSKIIPTTGSFWPRLLFFTFIIWISLALYWKQYISLTVFLFVIKKKYKSSLHEGNHHFLKINVWIFFHKTLLNLFILSMSYLGIYYVIFSNNSW